MRELRPRAQSTAEINSKAAPRLALLGPGDCPQPDIVNPQSRVIIRATFESDLELATEVLVVLVAHEIPKQSIGVRLSCESLSCRRTGAITRGDVAHSVAASFARSDSARGQKPQQFRRFFQAHVIYLRIFARREMNEATAKPICCVSQARELICSQEPARNLDALHLYSLLALSISAKVQTQFLHLRLVDFAGAIFLDLLFVIG